VAEVRDQEAELDRVLSTVLFTDIVNSTEQSAAMGDRRWQTVRADHDRIVRASVARYRGKALKTMGDGFLATVDGPARGVHCARAISLGVRSLGIEVRAGLHTGEAELEGDDVAGIAVVIGARVAALAAPSEVLVSRTVKDLVAGSGLAFEDRGSHLLKGVPDEWHAVASGQLQVVVGAVGKGRLTVQPWQSCRPLPAGKDRVGCALGEALFGDGAAAYGGVGLAVAGRDPGPGAQLRGAGEAVDVADLGNEDTRQHRAHGGDGLDGQVADVAGQRGGDLALQGGDLLVVGTDQ
jgi:class 3 adenylate cyclase